MDSLIFFFSFDAALLAAMGKKFTPKAAIGVTLMMIFGTGTMVSSKIMLEMKSVGLDGHCKHFKKPLFQSLTMFNAMTVCMFFYVCCCRPKKTAPNYSINKDSDDKSAKKANFYIIVPAFFDLLATTLMTFGLVFINVSIMQMLRGSMVIFSAILTVLFRGRKLKSYEWFGVVTCVCAMLLVGLSAVLGAFTSKSVGHTVYPWHLQLVGCLLVVTSQLVQASQIVVEEFLLADVKADPLQVVGMEGVWGQLMCLFIFLPLFFFVPGGDNGRFEDSYDTFVKVANNGGIIWSLLIYWVSILFLNYGGMLVTSELTAVHRTIFEAVRTLCIWVVNLFIYYVISRKFGEPFTYFSILQLVGFAILILSMFIHNGILKLPCFKQQYQSEETQPMLEEE
eukprot:gnl/Trimastix_PCT/265.p1 GENE.gnl/Trimastix_PCT/265~~gnl/Trimastix_PCT/265.p1  ORF type:complete len:394 (-),score=118.40 gnl/Trimastix_PCT/265:196-1377(-)